MVKLIIPKPKLNETIHAAFFRKSRRKTLDLAILNAAFYAKMNGNKIASVNVAFGGSDQILINSSSIKGPSVATNTVSVLTGKEMVNINTELV